jgi:hypothetical protein
MKSGASIALTRLTSLRWAIPLSNEVVAAPEPGAKMDTVRSDGLVLARKVGYEDWVRRAASIDAIAVPPIKPMSRTTLR